MSRIASASTPGLVRSATARHPVTDKIDVWAFGISLWEIAMEQVIQKSMSLKYEPASEPLHISAK